MATIKTATGREFEVVKPFATWTEKNRVQCILLPFAVEKSRLKEAADALLARRAEIDPATNPRAFADLSREVARLEAELYQPDEAKVQALLAEIAPRVRPLSGQGELRLASNEDAGAVLELAALLIQEASLDEDSRKNAPSSPGAS